jgi:hypothetical protein
MLRSGVGPFIQAVVATVPQCLHSLRILLRTFPGPEPPSLDLGEADLSLNGLDSGLADSSFKGLLLSWPGVD